MAAPRLRGLCDTAALRLRTCEARDVALISEPTHSEREAEVPWFGSFMATNLDMPASL